VDTQESLGLVKRNTAETVKDEELEEMLSSDEAPTAYIGYAPTGTVHIGHFTAARKIADFVDAGFEFRVLLADVHAELDIEKTPRQLVDARTEYYREAIGAMLEVAGIDEEDVEFVRGSSFQHDADYQKGYMQIMEETTVNRMKRAVNEVVRHSDSMKCSGLLYSAMQIMDCASPGLDVDVAYGGLDQRRIYMLGREVLPQIDEEKPTCVFAPLLSGLTGGKMSASDESSKIEVHDSDEEIRDKINQAYCPAGEAENNGVLEYLQHLVFPVLENRGEVFEVERLEEHGGDLSYESYRPVEEDYTDGELHPADLKEAVADELVDLIAPVRNRLDGKQELMAEAYPEQYG